MTEFYYSFMQLVT